MKNRNWFWGVFFLAAAVFVIASQVGAFVQIGFWSIAATVLLAALFVSSLVALNFFGGFLSLALLYMLYRQPLDLIEIPFWLLMLAVVLASIGFSVIFHPRRHACRGGKWRRRCGSRDDPAENIDGNDIFVKSSFSESSKYLRAESLKKANLIASFGKLSVFFDQVRLCPEGAEVDVDVSFAEMVLYLPKHWRVIDRIHTGLGGVDNDIRSASPDAGAPALTLTGHVSFGHLEVHYI